MKRQWDKHYSLEKDGLYHCRHCDSQYVKLASGCTTSLKRHMRDKHADVLEKKKAETESRNDADIAAKKTEGIIPFTVQEKKSVGEILVARFVAGTNASYSTVNTPEFRAIWYHEPKGQPPPDRRHLSSKIIPDYAQSLRKSASQWKPSCMALTLDEYSNRKSRFLGITATFLHKKKRISHKIGVISLQALKATGANLETKLNAILVDHGLDKIPIIAVTRDKGSNMVSCCRIAELDSIHCFCHGLQLAISQGLKLPAVAALIYRLQALVKAFNHSALAKNLLEEAGGQALKPYKAVRWHSANLLVTSCLSNIDAFGKLLTVKAFEGLAARKHVIELLQDAAGIESLRQLQTYFLALQSVGRQAESTTATAGMIPYFCFLVRNQLAEATDDNVASLFARTVLDYFEEKYQAYHNDPIIQNAAFCDPRFVMNTSLYTCDEWKTIQERIECSVKDNGIPEAPTTSSSAVAAFKQKSQTETPMQRYLREAAGIEIPDSGANNLDAVLSFWLNFHIHSPALATYALERLLINASSAEAERLFSTLTRLLSNTLRNRLHDTSVRDLNSIRNFMAIEKLHYDLEHDSDLDEPFEYEINLESEQPTEPVTKKPHVDDSEEIALSNDEFSPQPIESGTEDASVQEFEEIEVSDDD